MEEADKTYGIYLRIRFLENRMADIYKRPTKIEITPDVREILVNLDSSLCKNNTFNEGVITKVSIPDSLLDNFDRILGTHSLSKPFGCLVCQHFAMPWQSIDFNLIIKMCSLCSNYLIYNWMAGFILRGY